MSVRVPTVVVLAGGVSAEREVSLASGRASALALARSFPTRLVQVNEATLPRGIDSSRELVFSTLHGVFGEDGQMQRLLDAAGIHYAGCGAAASALTMDKQRTKAAAAAVGVAGPRGLCFSQKDSPNPQAVIAQLGERLVLKPNSEGSSVGLRLIEGAAELAAALAEIGRAENHWLLEERLVGRELSVGVLDARGAMGIVEIRPRSGVYDYASKYTPGQTEYLAPAPLDELCAAKVRDAAQRVYTACGCRDYARVDFILSESGTLYLLEINTLPGMKATSLLPMSARCAGLDFVALVRELVAPAVRRLREEASRRV
ncbi:D-alanine--D-alanine ligase [Cephaloticoccus capnophilus]|uniref:D-alanine--D-alanine ligase n=1 Tax=Cephaloticoccus capnophilus TaxID=1548208 RepID=A0A139SJ32_9BACT|nr:D-alanine--D-alanine ligase [Cephaloticoccus capnophilus]KXU34546.1 D-alanine--D-alanine ligase [Cephaloticoccus capnophilus]